VTDRREPDAAERPGGTPPGEPEAPAGGSRAPDSGGDAAGSAGGPGGARREVPQSPETGKGEDEPQGGA